MHEDLKLGQAVISRAGRDRGRVFLVVGLLSDGFVLVADGTVRRMANPKKKNSRHLKPERIVFAELSGKLAAGERVRDEEIRAVLKGVIDQYDQG